MANLAHEYKNIAISWNHNRFNILCIYSLIILILPWQKHQSASVAKGFASDITVAQGMPTWGFLSRPHEVAHQSGTHLSTVLAIAHFWTTALAGAGGCDRSSPYSTVAPGLEQCSSVLNLWATLLLIHWSYLLNWVRKISLQWSIRTYTYCVASP